MRDFDSLLNDIKKANNDYLLARLNRNLNAENKESINALNRIDIDLNEIREKIEEEIENQSENQKTGFIDIQQKLENFKQYFKDRKEIDFVKDEIIRNSLWKEIQEYLVKRVIQSNRIRMIEDGNKKEPRIYKRIENNLRKIGENIEYDYFKYKYKGGYSFFWKVKENVKRAFDVGGIITDIEFFKKAGLLSSEDLNAAFLYIRKFKEEAPRQGVLSSVFKSRSMFYKNFSQISLPHIQSNARISSSWIAVRHFSVKETPFFDVIERIREQFKSAATDKEVYIKKELDLIYHRLSFNPSIKWKDEIKNGRTVELIDEAITVLREFGVCTPSLIEEAKAISQKCKAYQKLVKDLELKNKESECRDINNNCNGNAF